MDKLISYKTAKLANEKGLELMKVWEGFNRSVVGWEREMKEFKLNFVSIEDKYPTQTFLRRLLREKYNIDIEISPERAIGDKEPRGYTGFVQSTEATAFSWDLEDTHKTFEKALEVCLYRAIELLINEKK